MFNKSVSEQKIIGFDRLMVRTTFYLGSLFGLIALIIYFYLNNLANQQVHELALKNAKVYSQVLTEFRSLYTSEVVVKAKSQGMMITHDYKNNRSAIPLPATFSMLLGNTMGDAQSNLSSRLYSEYPFPWREKNGGLKDKFAKDAWQALQAFPHRPFYKFEEYQGKISLRYARADLMRDSCTGCHNSHSDTPKSDWKTGDVAGVLEVIIPIELDLLSANSVIRQTLILLIAILLLSFIGIMSVLIGLNIKREEARNSALETKKVNKRLESEILSRKAVQEKLLEISVTDGLTDVFNRRKFDQEFDLQWRIGRRNQMPLSVIMLDVDHFKAYNDNYGHQGGDKVLIQIAQQGAAQVRRASDLFCRYGGEEFVILLANTNIEGAAILAEKVRAAIENLAIEHQYSSSASVVTVSIGIASLMPCGENSASELIVSAGTALYQAKQQGRNRSCIYQPEV